MPPERGSRGSCRTRSGVWITLMVASMPQNAVTATAMAACRWQPVSPSEVPSSSAHAYLRARATSMYSPAAPQTSRQGRVGPLAYANCMSTVRMAPPMRKGRRRPSLLRQRSEKAPARDSVSGSGTSLAVGCCDRTHNWLHQQPRHRARAPRQPRRGARKSKGPHV